MRWREPQVMHTQTRVARASPVAPLGAWEFQQFRRFLHEVAGIHLGDSKQALVAGRLSSRIAQCRLASFREYLQRIRADAAEQQVAIDLLTTNETSFFREPAHFDFLATVIAPQLARLPKPRVWCGASSSGEEPYTIAMVMAEALGHLRFEVLASDISTRVLEVARCGLYGLDDAKGIPPSMLRRHCLRGTGEHEGRFAIGDPLRQRVDFRQINLNAPLPPVGQFDLIFLRNVMIYFDMQTKREVLARMVPHLKPGGWFIVSHSESLASLCDELELVRPSIYRRGV